MYKKVLSVIAVSFILAGCSLIQDTSKVTPTITPTDIKVIEVEAGSFYFKPDMITVRKGEKVRINLTAVSMMHDFNIDELGVKVPITKSGSSAFVDFTPDKTGTFEYYCSVGSHRANGQIGKITVTE